MSPHKKTGGFTLLELLIAMIIFAVLAGMISGSFFTSLKKGRDSRRIADLEQIQKSLEMFYEDKKAYPTPAGSNGLPFGSPFVDGSSGKKYMQTLPNDPTSGKNYFYVSSDNQIYSLYACLENTLQTLPYVSTNFGSFSCSIQCKQPSGSPTTTGCVWGLSGPNSTP